MNFILLAHNFPSYLYFDHKPIFFSLGTKRTLIYRFFEYQVNSTKYHNLKLIRTPGCNLAFPDLLSRIVTPSEANRLKLQHKEIPQDISFFDQDGHKIHYTIKHEDEKIESYSNFYPINCQQGKTRKTLRPKID